MIPISVVHLLDDVHFGGVMRGLRLFDRDEFAGAGSLELLRVDPRGTLARAMDADLIITHFAPSWTMIPYLWSLRLLNPRARLVHVEHSYTEGLETALVPHRRRFRAMLALALVPFDEIVAVSTFQAQWLRHAVPTVARRVHVINPWGNVSGLEAVPPLAHSRCAPLILGAYGRFDPVKRFDILIGAMRLLPAQEFRLLLGGFGPEDAALRKAAADLPHVEFVGRVEDVPGFLARCDAIVIPSRWETFGQVAEEAKGAGRPIVVANVDALPAHVGRAGLVADCSIPESLAATLRTLPECPLRAMGEAGRASLATAAADRVAQWLALYARVRPRPSRRPLMPTRISAGQIR